jgi:DNA-binding protein Fis
MIVVYTYRLAGNVRELRNLVERITILSSNESKQKINQVIDDILIPSSKLDNKNILEQSFQSPLKEAREHFEKEYLTTQLKKHHGNISKTADFIGMERSAFIRKLKSLGIKGNKLEMNIIICGAGKVGFSISKQLSTQGHSVTVIDQSSEDIKKINDTQDVKGIVGRASLPTVLEMQELKKQTWLSLLQEMMKPNMIVCQLASTLFNVSKKIARH